MVAISSAAQAISGTEMVVVAAVGAVIVVGAVVSSLNRAEPGVVCAAPPTITASAKPVTETTAAGRTGLITIGVSAISVRG